MYERSKPSPRLVAARSRSRRQAMVLAASAVLALGLMALPAQGEAQAPQPASAAAESSAVNVLVFHGPAEEQDDPVLEAAETIQQLGTDGGFDVDVSTDPAVFTAEGLRPYRGVVFLSAVGAELSNDQERALESYVEAGGGFLGIHDAARAQERSQWFSGLIGARPVGALPDPEPVAETTASGDNPPNETKDHLVDGNIGTKWLTFDPPPGWVAVRLEEAAAVNHYAMTSANDAPDRDPQDWILQGSNDGTTWVDLDTRTGEDFPNRFQTREFMFENTTAYEWYRLYITDNSGTTNLIQLAELELFAGDALPPEDPPVQEATVSFVDRQHPANDGLPLTATRADQWLNWATNPVGQVHTVAQVNEWTYDPGRGANGAFHPISWCRDYDGGRSFYTGMGATADGYGDSDFRDHLLGAVQWTTGMVRADCQATIASNYRIERLTQPNQPGQLDQIGEPHGLDIAPDGTVFYIGKAACPSGPVIPWEDPNVGLGCGTVHQWDPQTEDVKHLATLDVFGNRGGGDELVKTEEGLVGIALDPNFMQNGWVYLYWMPHASIDRERHTGDRVISRFTYDHQTATLDLSSRIDLLRWEVQTHSCCHAGGGMDFDSDGNLYIGVGDSNSSGGSSGYSGNNWTQEFGGYSFQDARRTAGNTNDLNGKILRIHPEPDGSYTIPDGNLFPESEDTDDKTRPEIYVMGVRNISTLFVDPVTDWLHAAWVGPDAGGPSPELGPAKYETATIITSAGNQGWPYCMGNGQPYRDRSNVDASILTGWYDCDNLQNTSPRNTGLVDIPPARDNMIWYSPQGGGPVYPERPDGSGIPTYVASDATFTEPYAFTPGGCRAIMTGPTYHSSQVDVDSGIAWPTYWEDKWFIGDWCDGGPRVAVTVDPDGVEQAQPPLFGEDLSAIIPRGQGNNQLRQWMMTSRFGPDGALYMSDYGGGFFTIGGGAKLIRVVYDGGAPTPAPTASSVAVNNTPMTIAFTGEKSGGVAYEWDFGDGTHSSEANPRHTYVSGGDHTTTLTVTYADGETATTQVDVNVSCAEPDNRDTVWLRDIDTGVTNHPLGGGCTINDLIDDERDYPTHGAFVDTVSELAERMAEAGLISGSEAGRLTRAAADSDIGSPSGESGYIPLFDGTAESLEGWSQAPSGEFVLRPDGTLRTIGGLGMLWYTERQFADFSLKLEFRDVTPATGSFRSNSGVFVRFPDLRTPVDERPECGRIGIAADSPAWMAIYCGHEIQINDNPGGDTRKTGSVYLFDDVTDLAQARPVPKGEWSDYEIRVVGQHYTIIRDGAVINEFDNTPGQVPPRNPDPPTDLRQFAEGFIGLQNHGGSDLIEFRNVRVREL